MPGPFLITWTIANGMTSTDAEVGLEPLHDLSGLGVGPVPAFGSQIDQLLRGLAGLVLDRIEVGLE